ncbi:hypothetical protein PIB30_079896 [Stylosanthes scabra]|uniref:Uncharacterized protein n=1 Tax=Stylosanthes scabra TaxID=79078 RepID=A0ABU6SRY7_9FABA|nr:hypothetical protein [Stylosanthes scabra]
MRQTQFGAKCTTGDSDRGCLRHPVVGMSLSSIVHQGLSKQVMEEANSYDQRYIAWNPPPYQHHAPPCNAYQSNGFGDAYYGYEDPSPPYRPSQNGIEEALQLLYQERKELREAQK